MMGTLYLVATPIGNLEDITLRALRVLRETPLIAAEDTRHTRKLLSHFTIATPTISYHEHSPTARRDFLLAALAQGDVALVSDAGTPALSDPGQDLVRAALAAGYAVVPIPGATAAVSAIVASGLPTDTFTFLGFLPRRPAERRTALEAARSLPHTLILYEAPHRLLACLDDLRTVLGDRQMAAARELTKLHEEWVRGTISTVRTYFSGEVAPRGEFTLVVAGSAHGDRAEEPQSPADRDEAARARLRELLAGGLRTRDAATQIAAEFDIPRREAYALVLKVTSE